MKKRSKIAVIMLVLLMLLTVLTGCGAIGSVDDSSLEGVYWMTEIDGALYGFYLDGDDTFVRVYKEGSDSYIEKCRIDRIKNYWVDEGELFDYNLTNEKDESSFENIVITRDGAICNLGVEGGIENPYMQVSEDVFYLRAEFGAEPEQPEESEQPEQPEQPTEDSSETITTPEPEKPENKFVGVYWYMANGWDPNGDYRAGFYLDENGKYITVRVDADGYEVNEYTYSDLREENVEGGVMYTYVIHYPADEWRSEPWTSERSWTVSADGNIYYEWHDVDCGGIDTYKPVSEDEFYAK